MWMCDWVLKPNVFIYTYIYIYICLCFNNKKNAHAIFTIHLYIKHLKKCKVITLQIFASAEYSPETKSLKKTCRIFSVSICQKLFPIYTIFFCKTLMSPNPRSKIFVHLSFCSSSLMLVARLKSLNKKNAKLILI